MSDIYLCYLQISCWQGMSIGAEHFYGKLVGSTVAEGYKQTEVEHPLTGKEALYLNKKAQTKGYSLYRKGEMDYRFEKREQVVRWGKKIYKHHYPEALFLFDGDAAIGDPQPLIDGPKEIKDKVNAMAAEFEAIGYYEGDEKRSEQLFRAFDKLMKNFFLTLKKEPIQS